jgi:hypothetical protein
MKIHGKFREELEKTKKLALCWNLEMDQILVDYVNV